MAGLKKLFSDFMMRDKSIVLFTFIRLSTLLLFFISMFFGFIRGPMIINNRVSLIEFPGMWFFTIAMIALLLLSFYQTLTSKIKNAKLFYLLATLLATIMFVWGNIVYRVGIPTARVGYGFIMISLMLVLSWFFILKEEYAMKLLFKLGIKSNVSVEPKTNQDTPVE
ncbi:MAG TPA: hypothetical protein PLR26_04810 [Bacilli bacterium]|nr:hypothetical protein [Bacilli bacterium]